MSERELIAAAAEELHCQVMTMVTMDRSKDLYDLRNHMLTMLVLIKRLAALNPTENKP